MTHGNNMPHGKLLAVGLLILVVGIGIGYVFDGSKNQTMQGGHMTGDGSTTGQNIDQHFIVQMIPHHEGAIAMAKIALERSKRPEVVSLANGIIEAQEKEITDMSAWYQTWFGSAVPHMEGMVHMDGMSGDTRELAAVSAAEFDRVFLSQMIPHHEMAIMMAQMLQASTGRAEMKRLADNIITSQSREIEMMRDWLEAWY